MYYCYVALFSTDLEMNLLTQIFCGVEIFHRSIAKYSGLDCFELRIDHLCHHLYDFSVS